MQFNIFLKNPIKKWTEDLHRYFSKEDICMAKNHMKNHLTSLNIRKAQFNPPRRYHPKPVRMDIVKHSGKVKSIKCCGEKGTLLL